MECNRDEAIKAKNLAERSMENKDFTSARRFAVKAQQLHPNLEDISKIVLVCDVLCSETIKVCQKKENDWYAILKIEPTADEATIRKQYRKFVLTLHPDKNKFPGASDAFRLVNEAHRILVDRKLRLLYDLNLQAAKSQAKTRARPWSCEKSNSVRDPHKQKVNKNVAPQCTNQQGQQNQQSVDNKKTFWTACTGCQTRFMYYVEMMGKQLNCQVCKETFTAKQANPHCPPDPSPQGEAASLNRHTLQSTHKMSDPRVSVHRDYDSKKNLESGVRVACNVNVDLNPKGKTLNMESMFEKIRSAEENLCSKMAFERDSDDNHSEPNNGHIPPFNESFKANIGASSKVDSMSGKMGSAQENSCLKMEFQRDGEDSHSEPNNGHIPASKESFKARIETLYVKSTTEGPLNFDKWDSGIQKKRQRGASISDFEENSCGNGGNARHKMSSTMEIPTHKDNDVEIAFQDNLHPVPDDQEFCEFPAPDFRNFNDLRAQSVFGKGQVKSTGPKKKYLKSPAPDFSNFNDLRAPSIFRKGQIWAVYDTLDAMPRFYALIRKVFCPKFNVEVIWLEPDPDDEEETKWVEEGLPASCGKFRYGNFDEIKELTMFSHLVYWGNGSSDGTFEVHPRKGETWALYKDWDISWHAHSETKKSFSYEFVEVLSDYANGIGVYVAFLYKWEGISCIFSRETNVTMKSILIKAKERFRFSHRVPSFKMTDNGAIGLPFGSFELDPASLPFNVNESVLPKHVEGNAPKANLRKEGKHEENAPGFVGDPEVDSTAEYVRELSPNSELEFYNFQENICPNKFRVGQIWAIYCDEDSLPKFYCKITRIDPSWMFTLHVRWFVACPRPEGMISWIDNERLTAVGNFKLTKGRPKQYSSTDPFSHLVIAEPMDNKGVYSILPKKDQIWALYKNCNPVLNSSNLNDCEYEIVRVLGENDLCILVSFMNPIKGFKSVFRPQVEGQPNHAVEISKTDLFRFSHQIPAFQLTKEIGGSLQGFWELDAAALPCHLLNQ